MKGDIILNDGNIKHSYQEKNNYISYILEKIKFQLNQFHIGNVIKKKIIINK